MDKRNSFNSNIQINRYVLRSNVNINVSKTTEVVVRLHGAFDDNSGPLDGGAELYKKALNANPVLFQPYYEADADRMRYKHILFGNYDSGNHLNPYAEMVRGYKTSNRSDMLAQFEAKQNLKFITEGLSIRALFNVNRYSLLEFRQSYNPYYYALMNLDDPNAYRLYPLNPDGGRETLEQLSNNKALTTSMYFEGAIQYSRTFAKKHDLSGLVVYTLRESLDGAATNLKSSLPDSIC
jgi:hypothetical protein